MTATKKTPEIKIGSTGHGTVNNYPPTTWRYAGYRNGSHVLEHVKHPSQTTGYPDQFVSFATVARVVGA